LAGYPTFEVNDHRYQMQESMLEGACRGSLLLQQAAYRPSPLPTTTDVPYGAQQDLSWLGSCRCTSSLFLLCIFRRSQLGGYLNVQCSQVGDENARHDVHVQCEDAVWLL
jgi:hypothetical protein